MHKYKPRRPQPVCCLPNCERPRWVVGRCGRHGAELPPEEVERLQALSRDEQEHEFYLVKHGLPLPKWEYENPQGEAELIRTYGRQNRNVRVGFSQPTVRLEKGE